MIDNNTHVKIEEQFNKEQSSIALKIWNVLIITSLVTSLITLCNNRMYQTVSSLPVLPVSYFICLILSRKLFRKQFGLALIIIEIVMVCRFIAIPLFYAYSSSYNGVLIYGANFNKAVWLMAYEEVSVGIMMFFIASIRHYDIPTKLREMNRQPLIRPITIFLVVFWVIIVITNEKLRGQLLNFSLLTREEMGLKDGTSLLEYLADIPGVYYVFFKIGLIVVFTIVVKTIIQSRLYTPVKIITLIAVAVGFISSMWTSGFSVSRWGMLVATIISVYVFMYAYPQHKKKIIMTGICAVLFVILFGSILKLISFGETSVTLDDATDKYFSIQYFDEYFEGIGPVANGIETAEIYGAEIGMEGILIDTCYNFPYAMKILGLSGSKVATDYFHMATGHYDLIMPTITQGYMQFGWILSPIYSVICTIMALWMDRKLVASRILTKKLFYIVLVFWF